MKHLKKFNEEYDHLSDEDYDREIGNYTPIKHEDKKVIKVQIVVKTNADQYDIENAIKRGIYWGLDVKKISDPKNVEVNFH